MKLTNIVSEIEGELNESGFVRLGQVMRGLAPNVSKLAIISVENPCPSWAKKQKPPITLGNQYNNQATKDFKQVLSSGYFGLSYKQIKGMYGGREDSFVIYNITFAEATAFARNFGQRTFIFGERFEEYTKVGYVFKYIQSIKCDEDDPKVGTIKSERKVFINDNDVKDFYSELKGRKFQIPFYNVVKNDPETDLPSYEDDYSQADWNKGKIVNVKRHSYSKPLPEQEYKKYMSLLKNSLNEEIGGRDRHYKRAEMWSILIKYL